MTKLTRTLLLVLIVCAISLAALVLYIYRAPVPPLLDGVEYSRAVYDRDGTPLHLSLTSDGQYRLPAAIEDISPAVITATLAYEDRYFYSHPGINPVSTVRAALATLFGSRPVGASTITMQVARLRLGLNTKTAAGKLRQMLWALRYEAHYSKDEILQAYLNLAPYGGNVQSIEAAAIAYFGKSAAQLMPGQAIALAVVPQNPIKRNPAGGPQFDSARKRLALQMIEQGTLPERLRLSVTGPIKILGPGHLPFKAPHFVRRVENNHPAQTRLVTTLSEPLNREVARLVHQTVTDLNAYGIKNGAALVVDTRDMSVLAYVGSADFNNDAISGEVDGITAERSPGSTLKPFIYGLAVDQGLIHSRSMLIDEPTRFGDYAPVNADKRFLGPINATDALNLSRNIPAVTLAAAVHPDLYALLKAANVRLPHEREHYGLSIALGGAEVTMLDEARLYAMLANNGLVRTHVKYLKEASNDHVEPLLSPQAARIVRAMLTEGGRTLNVNGVKVPVLFKTGTSHGYRDAWCSGLAGPYAVIVWLGNFDTRPSEKLKGLPAAAPLFDQITRRLLSRPAFAVDAATAQKLAAFPNGISRERVCRNTGDLAVDAKGRIRCTQTQQALFIPGKSPIRDTGILKPVYIDKATGLRACRRDEKTTRLEYREFWPAHLDKLMRQNGTWQNPPPAYLPSCQKPKKSAGPAPRILSPARQANYWTGTADKDHANVILQAVPGRTGETFYWFDGAHFIGSVSGETALNYKAGVGKHRLSLSNRDGQTRSVTITVSRP